MKRSNRLMLTLGVLLAVVAFGGVLLFGSSSSTADPQRPSLNVTVVTAAVEVPLGTVLDATYLTTITMPTADAVDTYRDPAQVSGKVARRTVQVGEAFTAADFAPSTGMTALDVSAELKPGQRAMALSLNNLSGIGMLISAGDYVDVVLALTDQPSPPKAPVVADVKDPSGLPFSKIDDDWINNTSVKVLVQNVQVLGLVAAPVDSSGNDTTTDPSTGAPIPNAVTVVLSVKPDQAEMIRFAQLDGNLSLLLRSPLDSAAPDVLTSGVTLRELVDDHGVLAPRVIESKFP